MEELLLEIQNPTRGHYWTLVSNSWYFNSPAITCVMAEEFHWI